MQPTSSHTDTEDETVACDTVESVPSITKIVEYTHNGEVYAEAWFETGGVRFHQTNSGELFQEFIIGTDPSDLHASRKSRLYTRPISPRCTLRISVSLSS